LLRSAKFANVSNALRAQSATNVEHVAVVAIAIVADAMTIVVIAAEIIASHIVAAEQSSLTESS
jgi:hypothetical protein